MMQEASPTCSATPKGPLPYCDQLAYSRACRTWVDENTIGYFDRILKRMNSSFSVFSDGTGPIQMSPIGIKGEEGRVKRVKVLTDEQKVQIKARS